MKDKKLKEGLICVLLVGCFIGLIALIFYLVVGGTVLTVPLNCKYVSKSKCKKKRNH